MNTKNAQPNIYWPVYLLAILVCLLPLGLAGARMVLWSLMGVITSLSFLGWFYLLTNNNIQCSVPHRYFSIVCILASCVIGWSVVQMFLPNILAHPIWHDTELITGQSLYQTISINRIASLDTTIKWITYGLFFFTLSHYMRQTEHAHQLLNAIIICGTLYTFYGIIIYATDFNYILWFKKEHYLDRLTGPFINSNAFAAYVGLNLTIAIILCQRYLFRDGASIFGRQNILALSYNIDLKAILYIVSCIILFTGLILTKSRGGIIFTIIAISCIPFIKLLIHKRHRRKQKSLLVFISLLVIGASFSLFIQSDLMQSRINLIDDDLPLRLNIYTIALNAIEQNPFIGNGLGNFSHAFNMYRNPDLPYWINSIYFAHNTYLETLVDFGLIGFLPALLIMVILIGRVTKGTFTRKRNRHFTLIAIVASILIWSHALIDFTIQIPAVTLTYLAILAIGFAQSFSSNEAAENYSATHRNYKYAACVAVLSCLISVLFFYTSLVDLKIKQSNAAIEAKKTITTEELDKSIASLELHASLSLSTNVDKHLGYLKFIKAYRFGYFTDLGKDLLHQSKSHYFDALAHTPADGLLWDRISYNELMLNGPNKLAADTLFYSVQYNTYRPKILYRKLPYLFMLWNHFDTGQQQFINAQIRHAFSKRALKVIERVNAKQHQHYVQEALATDPQMVQKFLKLLKREGKEF